MPKIPACDRCLLYANEPFLVCAVHPNGPTGSTCFDFRPDPQLEGKRFVNFLGLESQQQDNELFSNPFDLEPDEELWEPEGASYYNGELIMQPRKCWTRQEQLELLDTHPMFIGRCPVCGYKFLRDNPPQVHWDCPNCTWKDDSLWKCFLRTKITRACSANRKLLSIKNLSWVASFCDLGSEVGCTCSGVDKCRNTCQEDDRADCTCNDDDTSGSVYGKDCLADVVYVQGSQSQLDPLCANF